MKPRIEIFSHLFAALLSCLVYNARIVTVLSQVTETTRSCVTEPKLTSDFNDIPSRTITARTVFLGTYISNSGIQKPTASESNSRELVASSEQVRNLITATFQVDELLKGSLPKLNSSSSFAPVRIGVLLAGLESSGNCTGLVDLKGNSEKNSKRSVQYFIFLNGSTVNIRLTDGKERESAGNEVVRWMSSKPEQYSKKIEKEVKRNSCKKCFGSAPEVSINRKGVIRKPVLRKVSLTCTVKGKPLPQVTWYSQSGPIKSTTSVSINHKKRKSRLIFRRLGIEHSGAFWCEAANVLNVTLSARVIINVTNPSANRKEDYKHISEMGDVPNELNTDPCKPPLDEIYCLNGGTCYSLKPPADIMYCRCPQEYAGKRCDIRNELVKIDRAMLDPFAVAGLLLGSLILIVLVFIAYFLAKFKHDYERGRTRLLRSHISQHFTADIGESASRKHSFNPWGPAGSNRGSIQLNGGPISHTMIPAKSADQILMEEATFSSVRQTMRRSLTPVPDVTITSDVTSGHQRDRQLRSGSHSPGVVMRGNHNDTDIGRGQSSPALLTPTGSSIGYHSPGAISLTNPDLQRRRSRLSAVSDVTAAILADQRERPESLSEGLAIPEEAVGAQRRGHRGSTDSRCALLYDVVDSSTMQGPTNKVGTPSEIPPSSSSYVEARGSSSSEGLGCLADVDSVSEQIIQCSSAAPTYAISNRNKPTATQKTDISPAAKHSRVGNVANQNLCRPLIPIDTRADSAMITNSEDTEAHGDRLSSHLSNVTEEDDRSSSAELEQERRRKEEKEVRELLKELGIEEELYPRSYISDAAGPPSSSSESGPTGSPRAGKRFTSQSRAPPATQQPLRPHGLALPRLTSVDSPNEHSMFLEKSDV